MILRKGAIAAHKGEKVLIPINMRDGSVLAVGKGNPEWNHSAPHGAGRVLSRTGARQKLTMEEYIKEKQLPGDTASGTRFPIKDFYLWAASRKPIYAVEAENLRLIDVGKLDALKPAEDFVMRQVAE